MPLTWNDPRWVLSTDQPTFACAPPYLGNGRLGLRLGAFLLGTDLTAPALRGAGIDQTFLAVPRFDHSRPLQSYGAHVRDGAMLTLPAWAQLDLRVGDHEFRPGRAVTSSHRPLTTALDLRTGEARMTGEWMVQDGAVAVDLRVLIPRGLPHVGVWQLSLDGLTGDTELSFGLDGSFLEDGRHGEQSEGTAHYASQAYQDDDGRTIGLLRTAGRGRDVAVGLAWSAAGAEDVADDLSATGRRITLRTDGTHLEVTVAFAVHGGTETGGASEVRRDLDAALAGLADGSLRGENEAQWRGLWRDALDVTALPLTHRDQQLLLAQQFYLLASYDEEPHPVAPLGLSNNQWSGTQFWDTDLWQGRALVPLWPQLARRIVRTRLGMLDQARAYAAETGWAGARWAWMSDETGAEIAPPGPYREELHICGWVPLLAWDVWRATKDRDYLVEAWPLLEASADFWVSRSERDDDGSWHIRGVLGPDESVHENPRGPQLIDDNATTNLAAASALRAAADAAAILDLTPNPQWREVADALVLLPPDADGIIPEYAGYAGQTIKQADLILSFFPLSREATPEQQVANVAYYADKMGSGPLMTDQVAAAVRLRAGIEDPHQVLEELIDAYRRCVHGPFEVQYEVACNSNSLMLTASGGLLAALEYGWWDYREPGDDARLLPRIGAGGEVGR